MTGVIMSGKILDPDAHTGRTSCENEGRSQGTPKIARKSPDARREAWRRFSFALSDRAWPC